MIFETHNDLHKGSRKAIQSFSLRLMARVHDKISSIPAREIKEGLWGDEALEGLVSEAAEELSRE